MAYKKSDKTKEKIMKAAIKLLSNKGYAATTTREISKEAGVANGTLFKYFHSKEELLRTIVQKGTEQFLDSILFDSVRDLFEIYRDKPVEELLKAIIKDRIILIEKNKSLMKVVFREIQLHDEIRRTFVDKIANKMVENVNIMVEERKKSGEIRDIDPFLLIRSIVGMIGVMFFQKMLFSDDFHPTDLDYEVEMMVDMLIKGIKIQK